MEDFILEIDEKEEFVLSDAVLKLVKIALDQRQSRIDELEKEIEDDEIELEEYCITNKGFGPIYWECDNVADKSLMEDFMSLIEKHGIGKVQNWISAMIKKFGK